MIRQAPPPSLRDTPASGGYPHDLAKRKKNMRSNATNTILRKMLERSGNIFFAKPFFGSFFWAQKNEQSKIKLKIFLYLCKKIQPYDKINDRIWQAR